MSGDDDRIRSMVDLLRSGATMTDLACPACSSPLFKMKNGDLWCAQCQKKVIVVKEEEQIGETGRSTSLDIVESTLATKIGEINERIRTEDDIDELQRLNALMAILLDNLAKVRKTGRLGT